MSLDLVLKEGGIEGGNERNWEMGGRDCTRDGESKIILIFDFSLVLATRYD